MGCRRDNRGGFLHHPVKKYARSTQRCRSLPGFKPFFTPSYSINFRVSGPNRVHSHACFFFSLATWTEFKKYFISYFLTLTLHFVQAEFRITIPAHHSGIVCHERRNFDCGYLRRGSRILMYYPNFQAYRDEMRFESAFTKL